MSAEEDPMEAPVFEFPLQDTVASTGAGVILKCIIAGTPTPEGNVVLCVLSTKTSMVILNCIPKLLCLSSLFKLPG